MKKSILVIDDNSLDQKMIASALEEEGHTAVMSLNFEDALHKARQTLPDLVLIDVVMPDITGFDACRKLKELLQPHSPQVILMTGKLDAVDPVLARKMGADDFVVKTSDMAVLIRAVRKIFSGKNS